MELALPVAVFVTATCLDDRQVGWQEVVANGPCKFERTVKVRLVKVIKKQAADAARLVPVFQEEVVIAPFLVSVVNIVAKRLTGRSGRSVPVQYVVMERVIRCKIEPAAEPPHHFTIVCVGRKKAEVRMCRRYVGVFRVQNQRDTHGLETFTSQFRSAPGSRWRHFITKHV